MTQSSLFIVLFGAQGSGKGTQARLLEEQKGIPQVATGDLFRYNLKNNTELGIKAKSYMNKGELVPDSVTNDMVKERLSQNDALAGAILDGYPRNIAQAQALEEILAEKGCNVEQAIFIQVEDEELMRRLTGRRVCRSCGETYHVVFNPPANEGVCDKCSGHLYQRDDDKDEGAIRRRLQIYFNDTMPVVEWYQARGLLAKVNGEQRIDLVHHHILSLLEN